MKIIEVFAMVFMAMAIAVFIAGVFNYFFYRNK